jgi:hypothetical protein
MPAVIRFRVVPGFRRGEAVTHNSSWASMQPILIVFGVIVVLAFLVTLAFRIRSWVRFAGLVRKGIADQRRSRSDAPTTGPPPGWYQDQSDPRLMRYYDGQTWTSATAPRQ